MPTSIVKWFKSDKGYGFIVPDDGGPDLFVHIGAVKDAGLAGLQGGQAVLYEAKPDRRTGRMGIARLAIVNQSSTPDRAP